MSHLQFRWPQAQHQQVLCKSVTGAPIAIEVSTSVMKSNGYSMGKLVEMLEEKFRKVGIPEEAEHTFLNDWLEERQSIWTAKLAAILSLP